MINNLIKILLRFNYFEIKLIHLCLHDPHTHTHINIFRLIAVHMGINSS